MDFWLCESECVKVSATDGDRSATQTFLGGRSKKTECVMLLLIHSDETVTLANLTLTNLPSYESTAHNVANVAGKKHVERC